MCLVYFVVHTCSAMLKPASGADARRHGKTHSVIQYLNTDFATEDTEAQAEPNRRPE